MNIKHYDEEKTYRLPHKPVFWITRPGRYIVRKIKWWCFYRPLRWLWKTGYQARRNRFCQSLAFAALVPGGVWLFVSFAFTNFGWHFPELQANTVVYEAATKETEEEALERRTEEILFENIDSYYQDTHKKALAEKVEALEGKIASTTTLTPGDTEELKKKLKRQERSL